MFSQVRKHSDPALQAEFAQVYKILSLFAATASRSILTGKSTLNGTSGRLIEIPYQASTDYFVSITPLVDTVSFDETKEIVRNHDSFLVKSQFSGVEFLWVVITGG